MRRLWEIFSALYFRKSQENPCRRTAAGTGSATYPAGNGGQNMEKSDHGKRGRDQSSEIIARKDFSDRIGWKQPGGRLTIEAITGYNRRRQRLALCRCECGTMKEIPLDSVLSENARSCGCLKREAMIRRNTTHGGTGSRLYRIWDHMRRRCSDRGIRVCPEWESFEIFRSWALEHGYRDDLTLGRSDGAGPFSPENCAWLPAEANRIELDGELVTLAEAARRTGIHRQTLADRYHAGKRGKDLICPPRGRV